MYLVRPGLSVDKLNWMNYALCQTPVMQRVAMNTGGSHDCGQA
jgi:hypothetical protein